MSFLLAYIKVSKTVSVCLSRCFAWLCFPLLSSERQTLLITCNIRHNEVTTSIPKKGGWRRGRILKRGGETVNGGDVTEEIPMSLAWTMNMSIYISTHPTLTLTWPLCFQSVRSYRTLSNIIQFHGIHTLCCSQFLFSNGNTFTFTHYFQLLLLCSAFDHC